MLSRAVIITKVISGSSDLGIDLIIVDIIILMVTKMGYIKCQPFISFTKILYLLTFPQKV